MTVLMLTDVYEGSKSFLTNRTGRTSGRIYTSLTCNCANVERATPVSSFLNLGKDFRIFEQEVFL